MNTFDNFNGGDTYAGGGQIRILSPARAQIANGAAYIDLHYGAGTVGCPRWAYRLARRRRGRRLLRRLGFAVI